MLNIFKTTPKKQTPSALSSSYANPATQKPTYGQSVGSVIANTAKSIASGVPGAGAAKTIYQGATQTKQAIPTIQKGVGVAQAAYGAVNQATGRGTTGGNVSNILSGASKALGAKPATFPQAGQQPQVGPQYGPQNNPNPSQPGQNTNQPQNGSSPTGGTNGGSADSSYLDYVRSSGDAQQAEARRQQEEQANFARQQYELINGQLDAAIPGYQNNFNQFKSNTEANIADAAAAGERQKSQAKDYYGEAQRKAAQSRDQVRGQTQRTFANLGTLDSRGEGSFGAETANQDSQFNSYTQGNLKAQADKMASIDESVGKFTRDAQAAVTQEEQKMNGLLQQIQSAKQQNNLDQAQQLANLYNQSQQRIFDIQDAVNGMNYEYGLQQEQFKAAQEQMAQEYAGLSPEFLQTGEPKTQADLFFRLKNSDKFGKIGSAKIGGQGAASQANDAINLISEIENSDLSGVTGAMRISGSIPGTSSYNTSQKVAQLKGLLQLAMAGQLKGQGAMSDTERAMLAKAATSLDAGMREQDFRAELGRVKGLLASKSGAQFTPYSQDIRVRNLQTGETGTIPENEFDPSSYERIS